MFLEFLFPGLGFFYIGDNYMGGWLLIASIIAIVAMPVAFAVYLGQSTPGDIQTTAVSTSVVLGSFVLALAWIVARCFWAARAVEAINSGQMLTRQFSLSLDTLASHASSAAQLFVPPPSAMIARKRLVGLDVVPVHIPNTVRQLLNIAQLRGCRVTYVAPNSPAENGKLRTKDIVVAWNGVQILNYLALQREMAIAKESTTPGTASVVLKVIRRDADGHPSLLDLTLIF